jgi:hypothetical protein
VPTERGGQSDGGNAALPDALFLDTEQKNQTPLAHWPIL